MIEKNQKSKSFFVRQCVSKENNTSLTLESLEAKYVRTKYKHIGITALIYCKTSKIFEH
jgi:hypothetical protein